MPIDTDSDAWRTAEEDDPIDSEIITFFVDNESRGYTARELADEFYDTSWASAEEKERLIQKHGENEFREMVKNGEFGDKFDRDLVEIQMDHILTEILKHRLSRLAEQRLIKIKPVDVDETDIPYEDWDKVLFYSFNRFE